MHHFTRGSGPHRTFLLHGFLGSGRNLTSLATKWSERDPSRTIYVCDLLGHGESPPLPETPTLYSLVPPLLAMIDASRGPVTVAGHSLGGRVALLAGAERLVERVIMLDISPAPIGMRNADLEATMRAFLAAPPTASSRTEMRQALLAQKLSEPLADWLLMNLRADAAGQLTWRVDREALAELGVATRGDNLWHSAERVAHKLRVIYGTASPFVQPDDADRLQSLGADVRAIEGAGHYLHVDALAQLLDQLRDDG